MEELELRAEVGPLHDAFVYEVLPEIRVLVLAYGCFTEDIRNIPTPRSTRTWGSSVSTS